MNRRPLPLVAVALVVVGLGFDAPQLSPFEARVVAVADGDTLTVLKGREQIRVRLWGIDAPETGQDFGSRARERLVEIAIGKTVRVEPMERDRYGRTVARLRLPDGTGLEARMVRDGFAWWFRKYAPADDALRDAEAEARKAKRGLWSAPNPVAPWDWRDGKHVAPALVGKFIASKRSTVFHAPGCRSIPRISEGNRLTFDSAEAARRSGRTPAKDCQ